MDSAFLGQIAVLGCAQSGLDSALRDDTSTVVEHVTVDVTAAKVEGTRRYCLCPAHSITSVSDQPFGLVVNSITHWLPRDGPKKAPSESAQ